MDTDTARLAGLADRLRALHHGELLVLPNVWDAASARVVADAGFPAVATASAAITAMLGHPDGEGAPWEEMFAAAARVARSVDVPVSMDAEAGYGLSPDDLVERLLEIGVVGCNLEDTDHRQGGLVDGEVQADRLAQVRAAAARHGVPIVVNARIDVFLPDSGVAEAERQQEAVRRGRLYRDAGVDCIYPIGVSDPDSIGAIVRDVGGAVNGNTGPRLDLSTLQELGVARVSYGPRFYRSALADLAEAVRQLS
jgi:2-methylisocitrate lyase-like PEP mutase family enzyme